jgi:hypothetical protein
MIKRFSTGLIVLDALDIVCISISLGSTLAYLNRRRQEKQKIDPIIAELKQECALVRPVNIDGTPMKPVIPVRVRGGADIPLKGRSLAIKNQKLARLVLAIIRFNKKYKQMKFLRLLFFALNNALTRTLSLRVAIGGSLDYIQIILLIFPPTVAGYLIEQAISNPLITILVPLGLVFGRGIENIPEDDSLERCRFLCKYAAEYHNKELMIEMENLNSAIEDASIYLKLPLEPLECVEEKLSLLERFKLRKLIESEKAKNRVQHFSKFIKNFPECDADPEDVYEEIMDVAKNIPE